MSNGDHRVKFDKLPTGQKFSWLYDEVESVKTLQEQIVTEARKGRKTMITIGVGIFLALLPIAIKAIMGG